MQGKRSFVKQSANGGKVSPAQLRERGFALCRPDKGEKKPTYKGWSTRSLEPNDFAEDDLVGILGGALSDGNKPGHSLVIIDVDDNETLQRADEFLPPTAMLEGKPSKPSADHRYYLVPNESIPEWATSTCKQGAPAAIAAKGHAGPWKKQFRRDQKCLIDFIGTGGQVVCPSPSNEREWVGGQPGEPAVVPFLELWNAVVKLSVACGGNDPTPSAKGKATTGASIEDRAIKYLAAMPAAISGQGGHDRTMEAARVVVYGFDLGPEVGYSILAGHYNPRCQPPWSEADLRHKCNEANTVPFGKLRGWLLSENRSTASNSRAVNRHDRSDKPRPSADDANDPPANEQPSQHLTDLGNAKRVVQRHGDDLRYCFDWKNFLVWDGRRFATDDTGEAVRRVKETQASLYRWAAERLAARGNEDSEDGDDDKRKAEAAKLARVVQHALKWEDTRRINACLESIRSEPGIAIRPSEMDANRWLLNVQNGTIDLRTGALRPHRRDDLITKLAAVPYDPNATCPLWYRCLDTWMAGNTNLTEYLRRVVGYALTADVSEQVLFFLHGSGQNGKSKFLGAVLKLLGDYGCQAVSELLMQKNNESHPTERADLFGRRFVATIETDEGKRMAEALMKQLTGGENVRARRMRENFFEMAPTWKIFLAANHKPLIRGTDFAVWRRIRLIPFKVTIRDEDKDEHLGDKLQAEFPGILAWAVRGCREWQQRGLDDPDEVLEATNAYQREQDTLASFLTECCTVREYAKIQSALLLKAYQEWSGDKNMTQQTFRIRLRDKGFESKQGTGGYYYVQGVGMPANDTNESRYGGH